MAYATLQEVLDQAPQLKIHATSKPSTTDAEAIVASVNGQVNSVLNGLGYTIPISATESPLSVALLKDIVIQGSIAKILKAMFYGIRSPQDVGANDAWREFTSKLSALGNQSDPMTLPDANMTAVAQHVRSELDSNISDTDQTDETVFRPTRDQIF